MRLRLHLIIIALLACVAFTGNAHAQLQLSWYTIDGGGGTATGGSLTLRCTVGQYDAGTEMSGTGLTLTGGFWAAATTPQPGCGTSDFNGDGDFGTDQDIEAFFACLAGNCCPTCFPGGSDFNGDGDFGTDQDIESFFRVLGGGPC
jgi:hypothetical protein